MVTGKECISTHALSIDKCAYKIHNYCDISIIVCLETNSEDEIVSNVFVLGNWKRTSMNDFLIIGSKGKLFHFDILKYCSGFYSYVFQLGIALQLMDIFSNIIYKTKAIINILEENHENYEKKIETFEDNIHKIIALLTIKEKTKFVFSYITKSETFCKIPINSCLFNDLSFVSTTISYKYVTNMYNLDKLLHIIIYGGTVDLDSNSEPVYDEFIASKTKFIVNEGRKIISLEIIMKSFERKYIKIYKSLMSGSESSMLTVINKEFYNFEEIPCYISQRSIFIYSNCPLEIATPLNIRNCYELDELFELGMRFYFTLVIVCILRIEDNWKDFCVYSKQFLMFDNYLKLLYDYFSLSKEYDIKETVEYLFNNGILSLKRTLKRRIINPLRINYGTIEYGTIENNEYYYEIDDDLLDELKDNEKLNEKLRSIDLKYCKNYSKFFDLIGIDKQYIIGNCKTHFDVVELIVNKTINYLDSRSKYFYKSWITNDN